MTNKETILLSEADELIAHVWHKLDSKEYCDMLDRARQLIRQAVKAG